MYNELDPESCDYRPRGSLCSQFMLPFLPMIMTAVTSLATHFIEKNNPPKSATSTADTSTSAAVPASTAAVAPSTAVSTVTGAGVSPGTSQQDFLNNQTAYWNQFLQGTGQSPGGVLPPGLQQSINQQADLIK